MTSNINRLILSGIVASALGLAIVWQASLWSDRIVVEDLRTAAEERLNLYRSTLRSALEKYSYLPYLIARDEKIKALLADPHQTAYAEIDINQVLDNTNTEAGTDVIYALDQTGTTRAASNYRDPLSFVGRNYGFRPYFQDAMDGKDGRFFAIGATTGQPGFFMSHPVRDGETIIGVAAVKIDLTSLQHDWRDGGEIVFVSDANGVVFLSSQDQWNFRTLGPLSPETKSSIRAQQQYRGQALDPLDLSHGTIANVDTLVIDGRAFMHSTRDLQDLGWTLHYLSPVQPIQDRRQLIIAIGIFGVILLVTMALYWRERQQKMVSRRRAREAERIGIINARLESEIEERRATETELRETQAELVQAEKLAALGKISAAIAHEINQPIAAIRTFSASGRLMLKKGKTDALDETLGEISALTERMGVITGQLKTFARKAPTKLNALDVRNAISNVEKIMRPQADAEHCDLAISLPEVPITVKADTVRLEQIFINLVRNAMDAVAGHARKRVALTLTRTGTHAVISVSDTGPGIDDDVKSRLFDPFFTTKDIGEGIGLGLSITYGIVTDLGGDIRAGDGPEGGAEFIVRLPLCEDSRD